MIELRSCPFCGAAPHKGLTKPYPDQLHGDLLQHFRIWCPHGCASKRAINESLAADAWNTRAPAQARPSPTAEDIYAFCQSTLIGFRDELTEQQIKFICDQISRKSAPSSTPSEPAQAAPDPDIERRISRLTDALKSISNNTCCDNCREAALVARSALASYMGLARTLSLSSTSRDTPSEPRLAERLTDVVMMLDAPDAYNQEYIAAVCRSILSSLTSTTRGDAA